MYGVEGGRNERAEGATERDGRKDKEGEGQGAEEKGGRGRYGEAMRDVKKNRKMDGGRAREGKE